MNPATPRGTDPTVARPTPTTDLSNPGPSRIDPDPTPPPTASGLRRLALLATLLAAASLLLAVVVRGRLAAVQRDLDAERARCACCTEDP